MKYSLAQGFKRSIAICILGSISSLSFAAEPSMTASTKPAATAETKAKVADKVKNGFIFMQSAKEATIEQVKDQPNVYKMTLKQIYPQVTYVSDRPARNTGTITHEKFIEEWNSKYPESLSNDAPNAFLNGLEANKASDKTVSLAIQLSQPILDSKNRSITYLVKPLDPKDTKFTTTTLRDVTLLIDDACLSCW